jgi:hypothetical protein
MLRTEPEARANELLNALALSAHHYEEAAELLDGEAAGVLDAISHDRQVLADRLGDAIRRTGDLPDALDPERVGLSDLALRARAWWHGREHLLHEALAHEDAALAELAVSAAHKAPQFRELAEAVRSQVIRTEAQLSRLHTDDAPRA